MKCQDVKKLLVAYLDGELTPVKRSLIELHLSSCPQCQQELEALKNIQAELRQALNMEADEVSPSPDLWDKLQQQLQNATPPSFWQRYGGWLNRPLWRAVMPVVLVILVIGTLWGTGVLPRFGGMSSPPPAPAPTIAAPTIPPPTITLPPPTSTAPVPPTTAVPRPTPPPPMPAPPPPFQASVIPEEAHYLPGEPVEITLSLTNLASTPITVDAYPPAIRVTPRMNFDQTLVSIAGGTQPLEIKPNETISVDFDWDQKDTEGRQVQPGWYNVIFGEITVRQGGSRYTFNPGANILIQYPQGVTEKSFDLNQSQTVNGVTVTLERVELTADDANFNFFFIPPGYTAPPTGPGLPPMPPAMSVMAKAEYTVNGITKYAGTAGFKTQGEGIGLIWGSGVGKLDPIPSDAKDMTFTITQINEWEGHWEFKIPLQ